MGKFFTWNKNNSQGQIFILALIVLGIITVSTLTLLSGALTFKQNSKYSVSETQAISLAEAGIDKAVASLNASGGTYNGESDVALSTGSYTVTVTNINPSTKKISSSGYVPDKTNPKSKKTVEMLISKGIGISFNYGVQVGQGGLDMHNNAKINGSVYSNGNITLDNGSTITGNAYVAGGVQAAADQQSDCTTPNCLDFLFGKNYNGNNQLDVAQSFSPSASLVINKIALKLKKTGSPPNLTVRLLKDTNGKPDKNNVLTSGVLSANLVTSQYGFSEVTFNPTPTLTADTPYWIVIDTSSDNNNFWYWSEDSVQGYTRGAALWSPNWQANSPVWNSIPADLGFKTYMGGVATYISGSNNGKINGSAYANTLQNLIIGSHAYYQSQTSLTVNGSSCTNNPNCHPNSTDPASQPLPISDANIEEWVEGATNNPPPLGSISGCPSTIASKKIEGSVTLDNGCIVTIDTPIYITGNLTLSNGSQLKLNPSYGASSGVIVVEGLIKLSNNSTLKGSGTAGSYLLALSKYDSTTDNVLAIETDNGATSMILYAPKGHIQLHNNASLKEVTGWSLTLDNASSVTYETGLAGLFFSSGPSGAFSPIKGTYQVK